MHRAARTATAVIAASTALAVVTGCGGSSGTEVAADAEQTLTVWAMGAEGEKLAEVAEEYEKENPHLKVKVTPVGWDVAHQKLVSAAAAGNLPDIAQMGGSYLGEFAELGVLEPVDTQRFQKKDFFPAGWQQGEVDGEVYGVPWYVDTRVLYYRTDLAEKAGVDKAPTDWKELRALASAYQKDAGTKWGLSIQPSGLDTVQSFYPFLYSAGGEIIDEDGKVVVDSPAAVRALKEYGAYFDKGLANKSVQPGYDVVKDFGNGRVPMFFGGPWHVTLLNEGQPDIEGKWAVAEVPADEASVSMAGGSSLTVSKDSPHKAAAEEFISYLTSTEGQADWYERTKDLPANTTAWESGALADDPALKVFEKQMKTAKASPTLANLSEVTDKVDQAIAQVTQGKATAEEALGKAKDQIEGLVQK
ncbi:MULTISPECIES: sugar ABC transporter substrate-binding protein [Streptomyces]|uniref:Sugar ABC transporter substrate-binding protein n=1 Tax=Streptomyces odorifer TaxID=53450 RepID=A0A7Y6C5V1_9ACTN|nr:MULTISPECIES: sugar ABC transporter substrate-binding protein [Streptomyces]NUV35162.1 sugar ABC transporter substrate-binding protein [Streptomyces sp. KAI-27]NUV48877.1 sugar ABC transporter substrate-binding protein [Streptomyces sp. CAI-78]MBL0778153.1 sugar ABC transporter substrate-binding protein [Streptomyces albidoflavus]MBL0800599.1 sugar ABC transporter substrate-binding protein [Streptomyces albidoflavus]MBV1954549.1 sugar ABC transporter substrate-binding protein [Streptomyces 